MIIIFIINSSWQNRCFHDFICIGSVVESVISVYGSGILIILLGVSVQIIVFANELVIQIEVDTGGYLMGGDLVTRFNVNSNLVFCALISLS